MGEVNIKKKFVIGIIFFVFIFQVGSIYANQKLVNHPIDQSEKIKLSASYLYLYTSEAFDWAFTLKSDFLTSTQTEYKIISFDYAPGFKASLGYDIAYDNWDTLVTYTYFRSKAKDKAVGSITPAFLGARLSLIEPFVFFNRGEVALELNYNVFDFDLRRKWRSSEYTQLSPFIGLKGGWINQSIFSNWSAPVAFEDFLIKAKENLKQKFFGIGPKCGILGELYLTNRKRYSLSVMSSIEIGCLYGHWSISDRFNDNRSIKVFVKTANRSFGSFMLSSFIGVGWSYHFIGDMSNVHLALGYQFENWFNHVQIFSDASGSQSNNLILQGLNCSLNFDF